ncbi:MAG: acyltransferase family protein [Saccharofermentans sp.]|nr:acyltransferase family protein [Saccharofermentans sp.]
MEKSAAKRNGFVDLQRFIFAIIIVLFHSENYRKSIMPNGYIAVEFFLVLSGYLLASKAYSYKGTDLWNDNVKLVIRKFNSFFPFLAISCVFGSLIYSIFFASIKSYFNVLLLSFVDYIPLQMYGFSGIIISGVSWYLSVLLFSTFLLFPILVKNRDVFVKYLAPIIVLVFYGIIEKRSGSFGKPDNWYGMVYSGMLRGIAGISLGTVSYEVRKKVDSIKSSKANQIMVTIAPIAIIVVTIYFALLSEGARSNELIFIPLMLLLVVTSFSDKNKLGVAFNGRAFSFLGKFSLSVYLCHYYIANIIPLFVEDTKSSIATVVYLGAVLVTAAINYVVGKLLINKKTRWYTIFTLVVLVLIAYFSL